MLILVGYVCLRIVFRYCGEVADLLLQVLLGLLLKGYEECLLPVLCLSFVGCC